MNGASQYLLVIYIVGRQQPGPIASGTIAKALDRSPAAATEMLQRLEERGLVTHEPYEGANLTPDGHEMGEELYETYTTLSQFFHQVLELEDYEKEALQLAGNISPVVTDRLASTLHLEKDTESMNDGPLPSFLQSKDH